jgi:hypothetical protein
VHCLSYNGNGSDGLSSADQLAELTSALSLSESPLQHPNAIDLGGDFTQATLPRGSTASLLTPRYVKFHVFA